MASEIRWFVFGEAVIGSVVAPSSRAATALARAQFGFRATRVQSVASARVAQLDSPLVTGAALLVASQPKPRPADREPPSWWTPSGVS